MKRRDLIATASAFAVSRCGALSNEAIPTVAQAQLSATSLVAGLVAVGRQLIASGAIEGSAAAIVEAASADAETALAAFTVAPPDAAHSKALVANIIASAQRLLRLVPVSAAIASATEAAFTVLSAFVASVSVSVPLAPIFYQTPL